MTNIIQSKYKASRRLKTSLWGTSKDAFNTKNYKPGQHGQNTTAKTSDYGIHLQAKQRIRCHYGSIREKQFKNVFAKAAKNKGNTGDNFIGLLESRLDVVVYRMNIAPTIFTARQFVSHGHIRVNGRKVNIASYQLKPGDIVEVKESAKNIPVLLEAATKVERTIPTYLTFNSSDMKGSFVSVPTVSDVPFPFVPEVHLVIELYSR